MVKVEHQCECIDKLINLGMIQHYCFPYNCISEEYEDVPEGTLCLVKTQYIDNGDWDDNFMWISDFQIYNELIPIEYCPICGKKIEYRKINYLTKNL